MPRVITQAIDNQIVWRWDATDPFGMLPPDEDPSGLSGFTYNPRFPGQLYDVETNLHYNGYRDYDPQSGRHVESDPIGLKQGLIYTAMLERVHFLWLIPMDCLAWPICQRFRRASLMG